MLRQRTKPAHPILGAASRHPHTHTHQGYPPVLGAGWPLAGSVQETRKGVGGGSEERGAQSGERLNLGVGEERGARMKRISVGKSG